MRATSARSWSVLRMSTRITAEQLAQHKTDGHMDIDAVRAGAIVVCPVKVRGAGVYMGDMHAGQGDGEIAGHTMDVAGSVTLQVEVVKNYPLDGPVLFPLVEDLPPMARPFTAAEQAKGQRLAAKWGVAEIEPLAPVSRHRHGGEPERGDRERSGAGGHAARHDGGRGAQPRDGQRCHRDRPRSGRDPGHVPRTAREARCRRARRLRARAIRVVTVRRRWAVG